MAGIWQVSSEAERIQRLVVSAVVIVIIVVFAFVGIAASNDSPETVFWSAIQNSMNTDGVTIGSSGSGSGTSEQILSQLNFGQHPSSRVLTTLSSSGATAETETLTTARASYTKYDYIHKNAKGKPINFASILGLWAKTASSKTGVVPPTFAQTLLSQPLPMPIGKLTAGSRAQLLTQMQGQQVYTVNFASVKKTTYNGRTAYVYKVSIQPVLYLELLKTYAPKLDMQQLNQVNPNQYYDQPDVTSTWTIDAKSKQLVKADYGKGQVETYSGWGLSTTIPVPSRSVTAAQLQARLDKLL